MTPSAEKTHFFHTAPHHSSLSAAAAALELLLLLAARARDRDLPKLSDPRRFVWARGS